MFFILLILKNFFINSIKYFFFRKKTVSHNLIPKHNFFFSKNIKNYFSKTTTKQTLRIYSGLVLNQPLFFNFLPYACEPKLLMNT